MAPCGDAGSRVGGGTAGDPARACCVQGDAGEVGPQRRARDRATDAAGLVPAGALQVDRRAGSTRGPDARKLVQSKLLDIENSLRGILRGFGLKVGKTTPRSFAGRVQELVDGHPNLEEIGEALLSVRAVLQREFNAFEKRVRAMARSNARTRLLMSTPAVGPIVALTYAAAIDDPARFKSSKQAGAHFGLTPRKYQSGETDRSGRI